MKARTFYWSNFKWPRDKFGNSWKDNKQPLFCTYCHFNGWEWKSLSDYVTKKPFSGVSWSRNRKTEINSILSMLENKKIKRLGSIFLNSVHFGSPALKGDDTPEDSQRRFLAQHSVAKLKQCCNHSKQCRNNVATLCCAKNRRCESSLVTSP